MDMTKARRMACPASVSWRASCRLLELLPQEAVLLAAIDEYADEQGDDRGSHQTDDRQLDASYLCLFLFCGQQVDVVCHIHHVDLQRLALVGQFEAVLQL